MRRIRVLVSVSLRSFSSFVSTAKASRASKGGSVGGWLINVCQRSVGHTHKSGVAKYLRARGRS